MSERERKRETETETETETESETEREKYQLMMLSFLGCQVFISDATFQLIGIESLVVICIALISDVARNELVSGENQKQIQRGGAELDAVFAASCVSLNGELTSN